MTSRPAGREPIPWEGWTNATFARAAEIGRPVVAFLGPAWCEGCDRADRTILPDPEVAALIRRRFVPLRVDVERRPDIAERYTLGGWPTLVCLTPEGELLAGGLLLDAPGALAMLGEVDAACRAHPEAIVARAREAVRRRAERPATNAAPDLAAAAPEWLERLAIDTFDARNGGFGTQAKWPHADVLRLLLRRVRVTGDPEARACVLASLDALRVGLLDPIEGGLFRYADEADWSSPHTEKLLDVNADGLALFLEAWATFSRPQERAAIASILEFVSRTLWREVEPGFAASQRADAAYYRLGSHDARRGAGAPPVDGTRYVASNARMVSALLGAADATGDATLAERAIAVLEQLLLRAFRSGGGMARAVEPEPAEWGQLADQVWTCLAALDAYEVSGDAVYLDLGQEIALYALRTMWDESAGGLRDRAPDPESDIGLLRDPLTPVDLNGDAARALLRLARLTGRAEFSTRAVEALVACGTAYRAIGLAAAPYALAVAEALDDGFSLSDD